MASRTVCKMNSLFLRSCIRTNKLSSTVIQSISSSYRRNNVAQIQIARWKSAKVDETLQDNASPSDPQQQSVTQGHDPRVNIIGDRITLYHRPSNRAVDVPLIKRDKSTPEEISLHFPHSDRIWHLSPKKNVMALLEKDEVVEDPTDHKIKSVVEANWCATTTEFHELPSIYAKLSKLRLTGLVVVTAMAGYAVAPGIFSPLTFLGVTVGTGLTSAAANTINQYFEVPYDSQMNRTKNRPIVRGHISPLHSMLFATFAGVSGTSLLWYTCNPLTAALGAANLFLYTLVYTPMKRFSIANTWVGSIVGAIPPMMGWIASSGQLDVGAWLLAGVMYAWQFPHFNALSWNLRQDYSRAGYRMMAVTHPQLCKRVTLRYSIVMLALCQILAPVMEVTTWTFAIDSLPFNAYLAFLSWRFYKQGDSNTSRKLFRFSLVHLPVVMALMLISKKQYRDGSKGQPTGIMLPS